MKCGICKWKYEMCKADCRKCRAKNYVDYELMPEAKTITKLQEALTCFCIYDPERCDGFYFGWDNRYNAIKKVCPAKDICKPANKEGKEKLRKVKELPLGPSGI